jgi:transposase
MCEKPKPGKVIVIDKAELTDLLGLPDIEIDRVVRTEPKTLRIYVNSTKHGAVCHRCGKPIEKPYGHGQEIELRHLPVFEHKTYIVIKPKRYVCETCEDRPTTGQTLSWYTPKSPFTVACEQDVMLTVINGTVEDASLKHEIGADAVQGILDRHIEAEIDWQTIPTLEIVGIDEIALKKGHRDFVVVVSTYIEGRLRVLGLLAGREKATVEKFFRSIPKRLRHTVKVVCSDLYQGFVSAAKAVFGKRVTICADRFHVARLYRDGLDTLRKKEMKRLRRLLSKDAYGSLKNVHWIVRKRRDELTSDERRILDRLFEHSPDLREAYALCEELTAIYESPIDKNRGKRRIRSWMGRVAERGVTCFDRFLKTLDTHLEDIANYFVARRTSGFVEGLNNKIKVLKRRCYGITNLKHLFQRVYLDLNGYSWLTG